MNYATQPYSYPVQPLQAVIKLGVAQPWFHQSKAAMRRSHSAGVSHHFVGDEINFPINNLANHNWLICGSSGYGKSSLIRSLIGQLASTTTNVFVIDVHGDLSVQGVPTYSIGGDGMPSLKPLVPVKEDLGAHTLREYVLYLAELLFPRRLGVFQCSLFEASLLALYESKGLMAKDGSEQLIEMPSIEFYELFDALDREVLRREQQREHETGKPSTLVRERETVVTLKGYLQTFAASRAFNTETMLELDKLLASSVVLNLTNVPDEVQGVVVRLLLDLVGRRLKLDGEHKGVMPRTMLVVDEASVLIEADSKGGTALGKAFAQQRKFGLGAIIATQNFSDFSTLGLLNNAGVVVSLNNTSEREAQIIANETGFFKNHLVNQPFGFGCAKVSFKGGAAVYQRIQFFILGSGNG